MDTKNRIEELERIIERKRTTMSKTSFRSWYPQSTEVRELCELRAAVANAEVATQKRNDNWKSDPATDKQIAYLKHLRVVVESGMTKGRAGELIEAAKGGYLGSVNGWYTDGSN